MLFITCSSKKLIKKSVVNDSQLTGGSIKYWNVQPSHNGVIQENCWIFRQNGTFSYYDYIQYRDKGVIEIMEWLSDDIKVGENGIIPWTLVSDTLEISSIKYNVLKLQNDSLIVKTPYSKFGPIDTILFTHCTKCPK